MARPYVTQQELPDHLFACSDFHMHTGKRLGEAIADAIRKKIDTGAVRSKAEVARHFGVKPASISDWERRGTIAKQRLPELWSYFSDVVDPSHWGMKEIPDAIIKDGAVSSWSSESDLSDDDSRVWVDRWDYSFSAGDGRIQWEVRQKESLPFRDSLFRAIGSRPKDCKLLMVSGDSMEPFLFSRDMIMVDITKTAIRDGKVYAVHFEHEPLVKQIFKQSGGALTLHSYNPRYPDRLVPADGSADLAIVGEVVYRSGSGFF